MFHHVVSGKQGANCHQVGEDRTEGDGSEASASVQERGGQRREADEEQLWGKQSEPRGGQGTFTGYIATFGPEQEEIHDERCA